MRLAVHRDGRAGQHVAAAEAHVEEAAAGQAAVRPGVPSAATPTVGAPALGSWTPAPTGFPPTDAPSWLRTLSAISRSIPGRSARPANRPSTPDSRGAAIRSPRESADAVRRAGEYTRKYKAKYHVGNWPAYDRALVQRGDITVWLAPDAVATWEVVSVGTRGGQRQYSDLAIETALTLRLIFHLPLRQTAGFLTSIFGMLGLDLSAPDHTTLSRRGQHLDLTLRRATAGPGLHLIVDSTGLSIVGEGEWAAAKHGGRGRRGWKKRHLGVDRSGVIVARVLTEARVDDATTGITGCVATLATALFMTVWRPSTRSAENSCGIRQG